MLERATGCLENGGRHLLRITRSSTRSRRALHSAFWCHGAGDIDLPSWWISLLQQPPPERISRAQSIADTAKKFLSAGLADGTFLDFLYPAKTLSLIHKLAVRDATYVRNRASRQSSQHAVRGYTSGPAESSLATHSDLDHALNLVHTIQQYEHPVSAVDDAVDRNKVKDESDLGPIESTLEYRKRVYDREVMKALEIEGGGAAPLNKYEMYKQVKVLESLERTGSDLLNEFSTLVLDQFERLGVGARQKADYDIALRAAFIAESTDRVLSIYKEAVEQLAGSASNMTFIQLVVEFQKWDAGVQAWDLFKTARGVKRMKEGDDSFWAWFDKIPSPDMLHGGLALARYAIGMAEFPDWNKRSPLRIFAIKVIARLFMRPKLGPFPYRVHATLFRELQRFITPKKQTFISVIWQLLSVEDDQYARLECGRYAMEFYIKMRSHEMAPLPVSLMGHLMGRVCVLRDLDFARVLFEDVRSHHEPPTGWFYRLFLTVLSHHGDLESYAKVLEEYKMKHPHTSFEMQERQLLQMFSRAGNVLDLERHFRNLQKVRIAQLDPRYWNIVIATFARQVDLVGAQKWYRRMIDAEVKPNTYTYAIMAKMYANVGDLESLQAFNRQFEQEFASEKPVAMIDSVVVALLRNDDLEGAQQLVLDALHMNLQGSRTQMWNHLLNAYALRGDLDSVHESWDQMQEASILMDGQSYAALMQAYCVTRTPQSAYKVLAKTMMEKRIRRTEFHYAILMGGYILTQEYHKVFDTFTLMLKEGIAHDFNTRTLLLKAAAKMDFQEHLESNGNDHSGNLNLNRAESLLGETLKHVDPMYIVAKTAHKGIGGDQVEKVYYSAYFEYMIFLYGQDKSFDAVARLYNTYYETAKRLQPLVEPTPSIRMLTALMVAYLKQDNHEEVERLWYLCLSSAEEIARRPEASLSEPGWVLPGRRSVLSTALLHYMNSLGAQGRTKDLGPLVEVLRKNGFAISNKAWNLYVQMLAQGGSTLEAFKVCEQQLMSGWRGWPHRGGYGPAIKAAIRKWQPTELEPHKRLPTYKTMVYLAAAYMAFKAKHAFSSSETQELETLAPYAVNAITKMPRIDDKLQTSMLRRM